MAIILDNSNYHPLITTVMVIDDQLTSRIILETVLQSIGDNIRVKTYDNAQSALKVAESDPPDLIVADYKMPELDGVEFTRQLRKLSSCQDIPVMIITIIDEKSVMYAALEAGATDFLTKPIDHYECKVRCRNLLTMRRQQLIIRNRANSLETQINESVKLIHAREKETLYCLARAGEFKDKKISTHQLRIGKISKIVAQEMGMDNEFCEVIEIAAAMHDIGKIGIADSILLKSDPLNNDEMEIMKTHTTMGYEILRDSSSPYLQMGSIIALYHHEKLNGEGYPSGLKGQDIPIEARIVCVADAFDTLINDLPDNPPLSIPDAVNEIQKQSGTSLDTQCVKALVDQIDTIIACYKDKSLNCKTNDNLG